VCTTQMSLRDTRVIMHSVCIDYFMCVCVCVCVCAFCVRGRPTPWAPHSVGARCSHRAERPCELPPPIPSDRPPPVDCRLCTAAHPIPGLSTSSSPEGGSLSELSNSISKFKMSNQSPSPCPASAEPLLGRLSTASQTASPPPEDPRPRPTALHHHHAPREPHIAHAAPFSTLRSPDAPNYTVQLSPTVTTPQPTTRPRSTPHMELAAPCARHAGHAPPPHAPPAHAPGRDGDPPPTR
jgi:hypothetical protein